MLSIYLELKKAGCVIEHHESDLYTPHTPESCKVIREARAAGVYLTHLDVFTGSDGDLWFDIPFMYDPFWETEHTHRRSLA